LGLDYKQNFKLKVKAINTSFVHFFIQIERISKILSNNNPTCSYFEVKIVAISFSRLGIDKLKQSIHHLSG